MNTKLHAIAYAEGRPLRLLMTAGQVSGYTGARTLPSSLPKAHWLLGGRGYDAGWFREGLKDKELRVCIPSRKGRRTTVRFDRRRNKRRNHIEIIEVVPISRTGLRRC